MEQKIEKEKTKKISEEQERLFANFLKNFENSAFPVVIQNHPYVGASPGLTKREYFAGQVFQGLLISEIYNSLETKFLIKDYVEMADELIKKLNEK